MKCYFWMVRSDNRKMEVSFRVMFQDLGGTVREEHEGYIVTSMVRNIMWRSQSTHTHPPGCLPTRPEGYTRTIYFLPVPASKSSWILCARLSSPIFFPTFVPYLDVRNLETDRQTDKRTDDTQIEKGEEIKRKRAQSERFAWWPWPSQPAR